MWSLADKKAAGVPGADDENFTFLGRGANFKGVVHFEGTVRVDGRLEGEVHTAGTLVVGESAVIKGIVTAGILVTSGKIKGTITVSERIQLLKKGMLVGDIRTPNLSIEEGAHFHGNSDMGDKWEDEQANLPSNVHDLAAHRGKARAADV